MASGLGKHLVFLGSFQFMNSSLDKLASNLPDETLKYTIEVFKGNEFNLMKNKGIYPYDYMDSFDKFDEKQYFYSILNNKNVIQEQYQHAKNMWNAFKMKTMGEYHDLYLKFDILLLCDVFEILENLFAILQIGSM